jgi:hypothetical protein
VGGDQWGLITRHVAGEILAIFSTLEAVIGPVRTLADDTELARLHVADLSDLLEQYVRRWGLVHGSSIYLRRYFSNKKGRFLKSP